MIGENTQRSLRLIASGFVIAVPAILAVLVIPLVLRDAYPRAMPGRAGVAFAVTALLHALLGIWAFRSSRLTKTISIWVGIFALLLGLALVDAGFAFAEHPAMLIATAAIFLCVLSDAVASVLIFTLAFIRSRMPLQKLFG
jgi:Co/Zn/Cd efflux system component